MIRQERIRLFAISEEIYELDLTQKTLESIKETVQKHRGAI